MDDAHPPARSRARRRALLAALSALAGIVLAEVGFRAVLALRGHAWDAHGAEEYVRALSSSASRSMPDARAQSPALTQTHVLHPYYGVEIEVDMHEIEAQARRFRAGEYDDDFVIVSLGGSVCAQTFNEQLVRMLEALKADARFARRPPLLISQARGAFKQPQQTTLLAYLFSIGWRPDAVIEVDGFNEVAVAQGNFKDGVHPLHPMWGSWALLASVTGDHARELELASECVLAQREVGACAERLLAQGRLHSALLGQLGVSELRRLHQRWGEAQNRFNTWRGEQASSGAARGPRFEASDDEAMACMVAAWEEGSRSLSGMCAARGVPYLHVLQPTLHDEGSKPLTETERATSDAPRAWIRGTQRGYPLLREAGARLAADGVAFADLSRMFQTFEEPTYYDCCHFRGHGAELFADAIVRALLERLPAEIPERRTWARGR